MILTLSLLLIAQEPGSPRLFQELDQTETATTATLCDPGRPYGCACPGGGAGQQVCDDSGMRLGTCVCGEPVQKEPPRPPAMQPIDEEEEISPDDDLYFEVVDTRKPYLKYQERVGIPDGYVLEHRIRKGWLIAMGAVFAGTYLYTILLGSDDLTGNRNATRFIPLIGPFFVATNADEGIPPVIWVIDGLVQMTSAGIALWAILDKAPLLVREDLAVTPILMDGGAGAGMTARF